MYSRSVVLAVVIGIVLVPTVASAASPQVTTFNFTGREQTYTVPPRVSALTIVATGAAGGEPSSNIPAGRGAVVSAMVPVAPGEVLYVEVGGVGRQPAGGFNGGGRGPSPYLANWFGGGGASDVRTLPRSDSGSLDSRLIVAGGGGAAPFGGDAGQPGATTPLSAAGEGAVGAGGGAGTQTMGGLGGCPPSGVGCGTAGTLGQGGDGGTSGEGLDTRSGGAGGGGLYGGGGGGTDRIAAGGGGGGSSLVPAGGLLTLAPRTAPPSVVIAIGPVPKTAAVTITGIRATPVSPGCETETGTNERKVRAGAADAACRHFRLTVLGAIRTGGSLARAANGHLSVSVAAMLPRGATMRAAQGSVIRGGWRVSLILPGVNRDPLPPRYLIIVRYHGDDTLGPASATHPIRVESERAGL
jgi:adhesin/invasin